MNWLPKTEHLRTSRLAIAALLTVFGIATAVAQQGPEAPAIPSAVQVLPRSDVQDQAPLLSASLRRPFGPVLRPCLRAPVLPRNWTS